MHIGKVNVLVRGLVGMVLVGCAPSYRELRAPVDAEVVRRLGSPFDPRQRPKLDELLAAPIDAATASKIAVINSPRLAAAFDELGIAGGAVASAIGLGPTEIHGSYRFGDPNELELDVVQNVIGLIGGGSRRAAARAELAGARAAAAAATIRLVTRVEIAFTDLLAAQQQLALRQTAFDAAGAAAAVRERMHDAGNTTDLARARDREAREQAKIALDRQAAVVQARRETLNALLGLAGTQTAWQAKGALRALPATPPALDDLEATAVAASLDLTTGRARVARAEHQARDQWIRTFVPELGIGVSVHGDTDHQSIGPLIELGIPLLDWRSGERASANAAHRKAKHELAASVIELGAAARAARVTALAAYEEARRIQTTVLPLRQEIYDQTLRHYNAMDANQFTLIVASRDLVEGQQQHVDAVRRYWTAMAEVQALERGVMLEPIVLHQTETAQPSSRSDAH
ncbi:MAG: TolC family protein [Kofleriaceae bacterium]